MKKFVSRRRKANDCALQHIKTFREQALAGTIADFGEPCQNCIHRHGCGFDWFSILHPLQSHANVKIRMGVSGQDERAFLIVAERMEKYLKQREEAQENCGYQKRSGES